VDICLETFDVDDLGIDPLVGGISDINVLAEVVLEVVGLLHALKKNNNFST